MAKIEVDGVIYEVDGDRNLLDACLGAGLDLPYFCWHPTLGSVGSCRQCAVKVYANAEDTRGRMVISCMTPVSDGLRLSIGDADAQAFRDKSIEVTMANHPHDCPVCEEGGECHLQDMTIMSHHTERRYRGLKKTYTNQYLGPCIAHEMNRCIACYRCVRFYNDYAGGRDLAVLASRENVYFGRHEEGCLESVFSGNLVEVCPTGVFTDKTLARSYNRKWDLQSAPSICGGCSLGCNISPGERQGKIKRIVNRYHHDINGYFLCDRGRFGYDYSNAEQRIQHCSIRRSAGAGEEAPDYREAIAAIAEQLAGATASDRVIAIGSDRVSLEANFALQELVGKDNFYSGMTAVQHRMLQQVIAIYRRPEIEAATLRQIEAADAVLILGEDILNSAPRMALSVRQATRNLSFAMAREARIPLWQDASVRNLAQDQRSPLMIAAVGPTGLDELASLRHRAAADDIAQLGFAIAHQLSGTAPAVPELDPELAELAATIAETLRQASNPVIISGTSCNCLALIKAACQVAMALSVARANGSHSRTQLSFILPAANSLGLALLQEGDDTRDLEQAMARALAHPGQYRALILQNDLYLRERESRIDAFLDSLNQCVVIDQQPNRTTAKAQILVPATTDFETEGTLVNNEGRAQRFFEVFATDNPNLRDNWKSIANIAKAQVNWNNSASPSSALLALARCENFDDLVRLIEHRGGVFSRWSEVAPNANFRIAGMKMPRMPHRFSGRTSLRANIRVAEPKQPEDRDSALGFTMEGAPINRPAALNAGVWSPGWNSNEALNKFQEEINGHLKGGDPGLRLFAMAGPSDPPPAPEWFAVPLAAGVASDKLLAVSLPRALDGDVLSALSPALAERADPRVLLAHPDTAARYGLGAGSPVRLILDDCSLALPLQLTSEMPQNLIAVPADVTTAALLPPALLPAPVEIGS